MQALARQREVKKHGICRSPVREENLDRSSVASEGT